MLLLIVTQTICLILLNLNNYKLVFLFKNGDLPKELNTLFKLNINLTIHGMQAMGVSAFQRLIQLILALYHLGILLLLHRMNISNQLMTLTLSCLRNFQK